MMSYKNIIIYTFNVIEIKNNANKKMKKIIN